MTNDEPPRFGERVPARKPKDPVTMSLGAWFILTVFLGLLVAFLIPVIAAVWRWGFGS